MSGVPLDEQDDLLAAELVLGLLEGDELRAARVRAATDPDFAEAAARWQARLAPLADEISGVEPGAHVWDGIARAIAAAPAVDNVVPMRRKLALWRGAAVGMTAVAASLALLVAYQSASDAPPTGPVVASAPAPMMIATLSSPQTDASLSVAYDPQHASMLVTPGRLEGAPGHEHQLWIIPPDGTPVSLGMVRPGAPLRMPVPVQLKPHFRTRATLAISVEPTGGSPTGQPTGPVIASGALTTI
jgi:anti-sigma-K factor RskA